MIQAPTPTLSKRGTKRTCTACAVRFYDLARDPITCPACATLFTPVIRPVFEPKASTAGKSGWRGPSYKLQPQAPLAGDAADSDAEVPAVEGDELDGASDVAEEAEAVLPDDVSSILEEEPDDGDVSALVEHKDDQ